jgi:glycosyltransferase involved in cell wall biosynthesis
MPGSVTSPLPSIETQAPMHTGDSGRLQRVLYAIAMNPDRFASMEEQTFLLTRAFQQRGGFFLPLFICSHRTGNPPVYEAAGLRAECLDLHHFRIRTLWQLVRLIRRDRIELIHWSFTQPLTNAYLWALTLLTPGVRHYFTDHTSRPLPLARPARGLKRALKKILYQRYARVFGISQFVTDHLREQGCSSDLCTRPYFLNTDRFRPDPSVRAAIRQEFDATGNFVVIVVAYLIRAKGVDVAIQALTHLPEGVRLWVVGGGEESARLEELCRELGVAARVRFFGHQPDVQRYMQGADCFVCPSRWGEAAALVNLEAQSSGVPALGSRIGGIPEYIQDGRTGFLFPAEDDRQLAEKIRLLNDDPGLRQEMQREARTWAVENFSHEKRVGDFLDLYRAPR